MKSTSHRASGTVARFGLLGLAFLGFFVVSIPALAEGLGWEWPEFQSSSEVVNTGSTTPDEHTPDAWMPVGDQDIKALTTMPISDVSLPTEPVLMLTPASDALETEWSWGQDCANGQCSVSMAFPAPSRNNSGACQCDLWSVTDNQCGMNAEPKCTGKYSCGCVAQPPPTRMCSCNDGLGCTVDTCDAVTGECSHQEMCDSGKTCTTEGCCVFEAGSPCLSTANRCGMFSYGTFRCDGSCSGIPPSDGLCRRNRWVND